MTNDNPLTKVIFEFRDGVALELPVPAVDQMKAMRALGQVAALLEVPVREFLTIRASNPGKLREAAEVLMNFVDANYLYQHRREMEGKAHQPATCGTCALLRAYDLAVDGLDKEARRR